MDPVPSAIEMHDLVISFVKIVVGAPISTAKHFLQKGKWRIEDALEMFYTSSEVEVPNFASSPTPETQVADSTSFPTTSSSGLSEFITRRHQRSHAQISANAAAGASSSVRTDYITCRRRRTHVEMTMDTPSTATNCLASSSSRRGARRTRHPTPRPKNDSINVQNEVVSVTVDTPPDKVGQNRTRRRRRTRAKPHVIENIFINSTSLFANPVSSTDNTQTSPLAKTADALSTCTVPHHRRTRLEVLPVSLPILNHIQFVMLNFRWD